MGVMKMNLERPREVFNIATGINIMNNWNCEIYGGMEHSEVSFYGVPHVPFLLPPDQCP